MSDAMRKLAPGMVISYSAGRGRLTPDAFRVVRSGDSKLQRVLLGFPDIARALDGRMPLIVNAYPATLGTFQGAVLVDTYLRPQTVSRALLLACERGIPALWLGQPLPVADLLLEHLWLGLPLPSTLIFCLGGYNCPGSLEDFLLATAGTHDSHALVLHAYGAAEVDYACLVGMRTDSGGGGEVVYLPVADRVTPLTVAGRLVLEFAEYGPGGAISRFETGDFARRQGEGFVIRNSPERLDPALVDILNTWRHDDWSRRTGYVGWGADATIFQLRRGVSPSSRPELPFHVFADRFPFSWLDKPEWAAPAAGN